MKEKIGAVLLVSALMVGGGATPALAYERSDGRYDKNYSWYYPRNIGCWVAPALCR